MVISITRTTIPSVLNLSVFYCLIKAVVVQPYQGGSIKYNPWRGKRRNNFVIPSSRSGRSGSSTSVVVVIVGGAVAIMLITISSRSIIIIRGIILVMIMVSSIMITILIMRGGEEGWEGCYPKYFTTLLQSGGGRVGYPREWFTYDPSLTASPPTLFPLPFPFELWCNSGVYHHYYVIIMLLLW